MERYLKGEPSLFSEDPGSGELRPSVRTFVRMPGGLELTLDESEGEHIARCRYCRVPSSRIAWSLTVAATDRRGLRIESDDLRDLVGDPKATGALEILGVYAKERRWMAMDPTAIRETPDFTFSPRSVHDRVALIGALRNACAPGWWEKPRAIWRRRVEPEGPESLILLGPPEENFGWLGCFYCETYRYGSHAVRPYIPSRVGRVKDLNVLEVLAEDVGRLLMKRGADGALGPGVNDAESVHDLRDILHALGLQTDARARLSHTSIRVGDSVYVYPLRRPRGRRKATEEQSHPVSE